MNLLCLRLVVGPSQEVDLLTLLSLSDLFDPFGPSGLFDPPGPFGLFVQSAVQSALFA